MGLLNDEAPDFEIKGTAGDWLRLSETLGDGPTVVLLNRGYWCSYCAEQLLTFSELAYDVWRHQNVTLVPVTGDSIPKLVEMRDRFGLTMQLYSDPELSVAKAYTGIENSERGEIPIPGTFIIDSNGIVRYQHVSRRPDDRTYANYVRHLIKTNYEDPYEDDYYDL